LRTLVLLPGLLSVAGCDVVLGIGGVTFVDAGGGGGGGGADASDYLLMCGEAGTCSVNAQEACCWGPLYGTSACTASNQCASYPILCDNATACRAAGKPADYLCCATMENCQIQGSTCATRCQVTTTDCNTTMEAVLCDPNASGDPCASLDAGLGCKALAGGFPAGYFACQP
jgi:hypothetical protein